MDNNIKPKAAESYVLGRGYMVIEDRLSCASCGEEFEVGQRAIEVPAGFGSSRMVVTIHLGCGINSGEVDL